MNVNDTAILNNDEAKQILFNEINEKIDVYFFDPEGKGLVLLSDTNLEKIRRSPDYRVQIMFRNILNKPTISPFANVGWADLRISKLQYDDIFKVKQKNISVIKNEINETERSSLYKMILGMAIQKYNYKPYASRNQATGTNKDSIKADMELCGLDLDDETIRDYLQDAVKMHEPLIK